jgi:hypothetical protein
MVIHSFKSIFLFWVDVFMALKSLINKVKKWLMCVIGVDEVIGCVQKANKCHKNWILAIKPSNRLYVIYFSNLKGSV